MRESFVCKDSCTTGMHFRYNDRKHLIQDPESINATHDRSMPFMLRPSNKLLSALALAATVLAPGFARAAVLGDPVVVSAIGSPLRIEIAFPGGATLDLAECVRIAPQKGDDGLPWVRNARLTLKGQGAATRLVVTHPTAVFDPALRLGIEESCESRLRREYTLLLEFPADSPSAPIAAAPTESSETTPSRAAPRPAPARTPRAAREAQPRAQAPTDTRPTPQGSRPPAEDTPRQDRLVLGGGADEIPGGLRMSQQLASLDRIGRTTDAERDMLRREQAVLMEIDRAIIAQMELNDRIRQLEEAQAQMLERAKQLAPQTGTAPTNVAPPPPARTEDEAPADDWLLTAALLVISAGLAGYLIWQRKRRSAPADDLLIEPEFEDAPASASPGTTSLSTHAADFTHTQPAPDSASPNPVIEAWDEPSSRLPPAPAIAPIADIDETAEEHESAIELAEIMMGFGRLQGAAETLAEFIASNPKRAVTPWLKLLEVYRAANLREEFDTLAMQLNKTFNVKAVTWDTFEEAKRDDKSIEQMAHISAKMQRMWGTTECQAYLERLLRDNRDGKREGFPLSVIDEILVLAEVLEDQLGAYRAPVAPAAEAPAIPGEPTEAEAASQAVTELDLPPLSFEAEEDKPKDQKLA